MTDVSQVDVLHGLGGQEHEDDHEDQAVERVVDVGEGRGLHQDEAQRGQHRRQDDEEGHERGDRAVLELEDVALQGENELWNV